MTIIKGIGINGHPSLWQGDLKIFEEDLKFSQEVGFDFMEIPPHGLDVILGGKINYKRLERIKEIMGKYKLRYNVHAPDSLNLMERKYRSIQKEVFYSVLEFTKEIGGELIVYHAGRVGGENVKDKDALEELKGEEREVLREIAEEAEKLGIIISIENSNVDLDIIKGEDFSYGIYIEELVDQVEKINKPNVGITIDLGHSYISSKYLGYDFEGSIKRGERYINNIHLHDCFGIVNDLDKKIPYMYKIIYGLDDLHLPLGWGNIPFEEVFSIIKPKFSYLTLELEVRHRDEYKESLLFAKKLCNLF